MGSRAGSHEVVSNLTPEEIKRLFPRATASTLKANAEAARDLVQKRIAIPAPEPTAAPIDYDPSSIKMGISTDEAKLNKNERAYLAWLRTQNDMWIGIQNITIKLANDTRFTADFWALDASGMRAIDCKGVKKDGSLLIWEDSKIKMKVAARLFPMFRFVIAYKEGGIWQHIDIKP
jgi:hypothetical protein